MEGGTVYGVPLGQQACAPSLRQNCCYHSLSVAQDKEIKSAAVFGAGWLLPVFAGTDNCSGNTDGS